MGLASVLLVLSPFTQINTPYPSTAYLKGYLKAKGVRAGQADLGIETILALFSTQGLGELFAEIERRKGKYPAKVRGLLANKQPSSLSFRERTILSLIASVTKITFPKATAGAKTRRSWNGRSALRDYGIRPVIWRPCIWRISAT